ncbi:Uncharacterised protein [Enterococcus casseliflavus]|uniref:hypothetical protein n=1 Tax=Enterococcus casseliflavus TaxID=37734 RepID=UPI000DFD8C97|nr:hypothetical protein [Enterococcus casseliflavus]GEB28315.1 hypothetical protein ECA02_14100 [Enterococcus casseliflavus]STP34844.1 Uncharacterised protein [Enterococcus casseliflavus]
MNSANDANIEIYPTLTIYYLIFFILGVCLVAFSVKFLADAIIKRNSLKDRELKRIVVTWVILFSIGISLIAPGINRVLEHLFVAFFLKSK